MRKFVYIGKMPEVKIMGAGVFVPGGAVEVVRPEIASLLSADPDFKEITEEIQPELKTAPVKTKKNGGK